MMISHLIQKLYHFASGVCWCTVLLEDVKVKLSLKVCESYRFRHFCGCNGKISKKFVISDPDEVHHWCTSAIRQHRLRQASLYSRHTMTVTSALGHDWQRIF